MGGTNRSCIILRRTKLDAAPAISGQGLSVLREPGKETAFGVGWRWRQAEETRLLRKIPMEEQR